MSSNKRVEILAYPQSLLSIKIFLVGILGMITAALIAFAPSLQSGFRLVDDYTYLLWAGTRTMPEFLAHALDPRLQNINYRPLRQLAILFEYNLFGSNPQYYHLAQLALHLGTAVLLFGLVTQFAKRRRVAWVATFFFLVLPISSESIFWISDESPLAAFTALLALWVWRLALIKNRPVYHLLAWLAILLALMSRESNVIVPIVLFLLDRLIIQTPGNLTSLFRRYAPLALLVLVYLMLEYSIQSRGVFMKAGGYSLGEHIVTNSIAYLAMLVLPWSTTAAIPNDWIFAGLGILFIALVLIKRNKPLLFLGLGAFLATGPVVLAALGPGARYTYLATTCVAIIWALGIDKLVATWRLPQIRGAVCLGLSAFIVLNALATNSLAATYAENVRQTRVPFRDILQAHPDYPKDTRIFFIEPPGNPSIADLAGMFFLRYGKNVSVNGTFHDGRPYTGGYLRTESANLNAYSHAYVYYFDSANHPIEIIAAAPANLGAEPQLPADFQVPIRLERVETTQTSLGRGQTLALVLDWRATGKIDKDYTVFVHLVDQNENLIAGIDEWPRNGNEKTSQWQIDQFTPDAHILTLPKDVLANSDYWIEAGLYYLPTMERVQILNAPGKTNTDLVRLGPLHVTE